MKKGLIYLCCFARDVAKLCHICSLILPSATYLLSNQTGPKGKKIQTKKKTPTTFCIHSCREQSESIYFWEAKCQHSLNSPREKFNSWEQVAVLSNVVWIELFPACSKKQTLSKIKNMDKMWYVPLTAECKLVSKGSSQVHLEGKIIFTVSSPRTSKSFWKNSEARFVCNFYLWARPSRYNRIYSEQITINIC